MHFLIQRVWAGVESLHFWQALRWWGCWLLDRTLSSVGPEFSNLAGHGDTGGALWSTEFSGPCPGDVQLWDWVPAWPHLARWPRNSALALLSPWVVCLYMERECLPHRDLGEIMEELKGKNQHFLWAIKIINSKQLLDLVHFFGGSSLTNFYLFGDWYVQYFYLFLNQFS